MSVLNKSLHSSTLGEVLFLFVQLIRALFQLLVIGRWLERALVKYLDRREVTIAESRMYLYAYKMAPSGLAIETRPIRFFGCILASACGFSAASAPVHLIDEMQSAVCLFDDMKGPHTGFSRRITHAFLKLATLLLDPLETDIQSQDHNDWTLMRMTTRSPPHTRLPDMLAEIMRQIPSLKDMAQVRAITTAGMLCFVMRVRAHTLKICAISLLYRTLLRGC
jgi:hypothetical protein